MITITTSHGSPLDEPLHLPVPNTAAWREAQRAGMDLPMLYANIRMAPAERVRQHAAALDLAVTLRDAYRKQHARPGEAA